MEESNQVPTTKTIDVTPTDGVGECLIVVPVVELPATDFTKVDNNLTGIGFFTASSKRSRKAIEKTTIVVDQGTERRISILPSAKYGLPITQDQDYWLALMKLVTEQLQQDHESGDFGRALEGYSERAKMLEDVIAKFAKHDFWRCARRECNCGLNLLTDKLQIPRIAVQ